MGHLRRSQSVQSHLRIALFQLSEQLLIELYAQIWVHTALQQKLVASELQHSLNLGAILLHRGYKVSLLLVRLAVKVTEQTSRRTYICDIYVTVNLPRYDALICHLLAAQQVGLVSKFPKRSLLVEAQGLLVGQQPAIVRLSVYLFE